MNKLNCGIGDLAITVKSSLPANLGNIVRIIAFQGLREWRGFEGLIHVWNVEIIGEGRFLHYKIEDELFLRKDGPVPDPCLRRITPPHGYLMDKILDSESIQQELFLEDINAEEGVSQS